MTPKAPCIKCGEYCASQDEFIESNGGKRWPYCSGCDPHMPESMSDNEKIAKAIELAVRYGGIEGDHHRAWVIDQIVRVLTGCPTVTKTSTDSRGQRYQYEALGESEHYKGVVASACAGEDGPNTYEWDEGIPP